MRHSLVFSSANSAQDRRGPQPACSAPSFHIPSPKFPQPQLALDSPMLVRAKMTPDVITASPDTSLADALKLTRGNRIRHLPVVQDGQLVGLVTDRDLRLAMPPVWASDTDHQDLRNALTTRTVGEFMVKAIITTTPDAPIEDAARQLYEHRIGCLPVLDAGEMVGIITETDVLRAFVELFGADEHGTRIEIMMQNKPGELSRVVRAIGVDFKVNINGIVMPRI